MSLLATIRLAVPLLRGDFPTSVVDGLTIIDVREDRHRDHDQVEAVFQEAMAHLSQYGARFHELVTVNIEEVLVLDALGEHVGWLGRTYSTMLPIRHRRNTLYLACRLVWAAEYFRVLRTLPWYRRRAARQPARVAARQAWLTFARSLPDSEDWEHYLHQHPL